MLLSSSPAGIFKQIPFCCQISCRLFYMLLTFVFSFQLYAQPPLKLVKRIDEAVYQYHQIDFEKYPGFVIGVIDNDSVYFFSYGKSSEDSLRLPEKNDLFEIGEVTQVFTALLTEKLILQDKFSPDSKVVSLVQGLNNCGFDSLITIQQLLRHSSGVPKIPDNLGNNQSQDNPYQGYSILDFKSFICERATSDAGMKDKYRFSQVGYALLSAVIQDISHIRLDKILQDEIFKPLNMTRSGLEGNLTGDTLVRGFTAGGTPAFPWDTNIFQGALGMESTAGDLIQFLRIMLQQEPSLLVKAFNSTLKPVMETGMDKRSHVAEGWHVYKIKKNYDICLAAGHTGGHSAFIGLVRETRTGVVILANTENGLSHLGLSVLEILNYKWKRK